MQSKPVRLFDSSTYWLIYFSISVSDETLPDVTELSRL